MTPKCTVKALYQKKQKEMCVWGEGDHGERAQGE